VLVDLWSIKVLDLWPGYLFLKLFFLFYLHYSKHPLYLMRYLFISIKKTITMELRNYFDGQKNHGYYFTSNLIGQLFITGSVATAWGEARNLDQFLDNLKLSNNWLAYGYKLKYVVCAQEYFGFKGLFYTAYFEKQEN
jgi:hypothetical protein